MHQISFENAVDRVREEFAKPDSEISNYGKQVINRMFWRYFRNTEPRQKLIGLFLLEGIECEEIKDLDIHIVLKEHQPQFCNMAFKHKAFCVYLKDKRLTIDPDTELGKSILEYVKQDRRLKELLDCSEENGILWDVDQTLIVPMFVETANGQIVRYQKAKEMALSVGKRLGWAEKIPYCLLKEKYRFDWPCIKWFEV